MTDRKLDYSEMYMGVRTQWLSKRNYIEHVQKGGDSGRDKRPDVWYSEQRSILAALYQIGLEFHIIAANAASYDAWKASLPKKEKRDEPG